eukprot:SAG11_NODE_301_length_11038_cov_2.312826_9_plen_523_part_00
MAKEVQGLSDQKDKLIKEAIEDMKKLHKSDDFNEVNATLAKYRGWPEQVREQFTELQQRKEDLVNSAKEKLLELCSGSDPTALKNGLDEFEMYGEAVSEQRRAVDTRRETLFRQAQEEMLNTSKKQDISMEEMQTIIDKYAEYPTDEIGSALMALRGALSRKSSSLGAEITRLIVDRVKDVTLVDDMLAKYATEDSSDNSAPASKSAAAGKPASAKDAAAERPKINPLQSEIDDLKKYRKQLEEDVKSQLKEATKMQHPAEIQGLLAEAAPFSEKGPWGDGVAAEMKTLQSHEEKLLKTAKDEISKLLKIDDFPSLDQALGIYESYPVEAIEHEMNNLRQKHEEMVTDARGKLLELLDAGDPTMIVGELEKYETYGDVLNTQREAAKKRIDDIVQKALREIASLQSKPDATMQEMQELENKYCSFPAKVKSNLEVLKAMKRNAMSAAKERVRMLMSGSDIKEIDKWLAEIQQISESDSVSSDSAAAKGSSSATAAKKSSSASAGAANARTFCCLDCLHLTFC